MFSQNTMFSKNASKANIIDTDVKHFLSAYLSFRETGCSYAESVEAARCAAGLSVDYRNLLIKSALMYFQKIFSFSTISETEKVNILKDVHIQLDEDNYLEAKLCAIAQFSECLDLIDFSKIDLSYLNLLLSERIYSYNLAKSNPYVLFLHAKLLAQVNQVANEGKDEGKEQFLVKQYLMEQFAHLKTDSDQIGEEYGVFGSYVKAVANDLFAQALLIRGQASDKKSTDITCASELLNEAQNSVKKVADHLEGINLIEEMILTGKISENKADAKQMMVELEQIISDKKEYLSTQL
jgi:hypothetical protein